MKWAMSDDYAALLTTLIVAVLAVGTIQTYTLMKRWGDTETERVRLTSQARERVLEAMRQGQDPGEEDLRQAFVPVFNLGMNRKAVPAYVAGFVWVVVVTTLGAFQVKILRWAAAEGDPADPQLARKAFYAVSIAIALLLAEGMIRAFSQMLSEQWTAVKPLRQYSRSERRRAIRTVRQFRKTGQVPTPASPPTPPNAP